jgi:cell division protein FtsL
MIGQRLSAGGNRVAARASTLRARRQPAIDRTGSVAPVVALRERLADGLQHSVLMQLMLAMSFVALAGMLYLAQASQTSVLQFNIQDLHYTQTQLAAQNASLQAAATSLNSVTRVNSLALGRFQMTKPDFSHAIWINVSAPTVVLLQPAYANVRSAQRQSRPAAWIVRFLSVVKNSL